MVFNRILSMGSTEVTLPRSLNAGTIFTLIDSVIDPDENPRYSKIVFNWRNVDFVEPIGVTVLSNLIEYLKKVGVRVSFGDHTMGSQGLHYLDDAGFFRHYIQKSIYSGAAVRSTTLPLQLVDYDKSYNYVDRTLVPWLSNRFEMKEQNLGTIKVCFQEIFNNIRDHSQQSIGCSFAQHYPNNKEVKIAISDFGVGIPSNVKKVRSGLTDQQSIALACQEGFTTQSTKRNRGAGLDVLIKNVVGRNKGAIIIYSRRGVFSCAARGDMIDRTPRAARGFYPGTLLNIILRVNNNLGDDDAEEAFSWTS